MDLGLRGRTALVLGSTRGLGLAVAKRLVAEGVRVVVVGRDEDGSKQRAAEIGAAGAVGEDLACSGSATRIAERAQSIVGDIDILVMNSGGPPLCAAAEIDVSLLRDSLEVLLIRQIELAGHLLPRMLERRWGRLVAIGSSGVQQPINNLALSNIGRAGLAAYLKTLANEVARHGVTANMVLPGRISTERVAALDAMTAERQGITAEEVRRRSQSAIPVGRYGRPEEFGALVAFICSDLAGYITGEQIRCDGGLVRSY